MVDDLAEVVDNTDVNPDAGNSYGLAIDRDGDIWVSQWWIYNPSHPVGRITQLKPDGTLVDGFPKAYDGAWNDRGITVTPKDNHVWVANSGGAGQPFLGTTVARFDQAGTLQGLIPLSSGPPDYQGPTGLSADRNGHVWVSCNTSSKLKRITPALGTVTRTIDLNSNGIQAAQPYNYSDMTGIQAAMALKWGMWTDIHDSGMAGSRWSLVTWNPPGTCTQDADTSIRVQIRAADSTFGPIGVTREGFVEVENGVPIEPALVGRYVQVRAFLLGDSVPPAYGTPWLCELTISGDAGLSTDCNDSGTADTCEFDDCNGNCIPDADDIGQHTSQDVNLDGIPDECAPPVIYVDASARGWDNGTSWTHAFADLQKALALVEKNCTPAREIWVAAGIYRPGGRPYAEDDTAVRESTFQLLSGVEVYGGFGGWETRRDQRNHRANVSILSGDLNGDDLPDFVNYEENAFHVVTVSGVDATAVLDGFSITGGNADWYSSNLDGAGMFMDAGSPTIGNCAFRHNQAYGSGGGLLASNNSSPVLTNCSFDENLADTTFDGMGGGISIQYGGVLSAFNCLLNGNRARYGAGMSSWHAHALAVNCTITNNRATVFGGGVDAAYSTGGSPLQGKATLVNSILWGNSLAPGGAGLELSNRSGPNSLLEVSYSDLKGGQADVYEYDGNALQWGAGNLVGSESDNPLFKDPDGLDGIPGNADDDLRLLATSPCGDRGDDAAVPIQVATDLDGNPRKADGDGDGLPRVDVGAYEIFADCNANGIPDDRDTPRLISAVSRTANQHQGLGGFCDTSPIFPGGRVSEPHQSGIGQVRLTFDGSASTTCVSSLLEATCAAPEFGPYTGEAQRSDDVSGNELVLSFSPALENGRTYRFNVTGGSVEIRGLRGDVNNNGFVNGNDRSTVVGVWTSPEGFSCATDVNGDGVTNASDRSIVVGAWTSPQNCAPASLLGMGEGTTGADGDGMMAGAAYGEEPSAPPGPGDDSWTYQTSAVVVEVRPLGGGPALPELEAHTQYELYYVDAAFPVQGYSLFVLTGSQSPGLSSARPADSGPWSATGLFEHVHKAEAPTSESNRIVRDVVLDDFREDAQLASGFPLCVIETATPGSLALQLRMYRSDSGQRVIYESVGEAVLTVSESH